MSRQADEATPEQAAEPVPAPRKDKSFGSSAVELVLIVAIALGLALGIQAFLIKPYRIPSESMEPTLITGQRVLVNRIGNRFGDPKVGDVLVFHPPDGADSNECGDPNLRPGQPCDRPVPHESSVNFIKRVVAVGGDTVSIRNGHAFVNGKRQKDSFTRPCDGGSGCDFTTPITVPRGYYFMMGDNRGRSDDSRYWGPIPRSWIIGKAFATYWPPNRIGPL